MKIIFIADFFSSELNGGAENNDSVLIEYLKNNGYKIRCIKSHNFDESIYQENDFFIVSNFVALDEKYKALLKKKQYIIYEHDHKYVKRRDVSKYADFVIPKEDFVNEKFYRDAKAVVVLSDVCKKILDKNLNTRNVFNIGCSLWSNKKLDLIASLSTKQKNNKFAIINSNNPIKNTNLAIAYCKKNNIDFDMIELCNHEELLSKLSDYKGLVFFPGVLETFSRISAEAKMLNCKLLTKPKMLGFASEDIFVLSGIELIEEIRERNNKALKLFKSLL